MQHYKEARRDRINAGRAPAPTSSSSSAALARPSAADQSLASLASPSLLSGSTARGGDGQDKGAMRASDALMTPLPPQPAMRAAGERQFLYIQVQGRACRV